MRHSQSLPSQDEIWPHQISFEAVQLRIVRSCVRLRMWHFTSAADAESPALQHLATHSHSLSCSVTRYIRVRLLR